MFGTGLGVYFPILLYLLSLAGCMVSLIRPVVGIWILTLILPLQGGRMRLLEYPLGSRVLQLLLLSVLIGVIMNGGSIVPPKRMRKVVVALCVITYVSLWLGAFMLPTVPFPFFTSTDDGGHTPFGYWFTFMHMPLLFVLVNSTIKDKKQMQLLLFAMMISFLWTMKNFYGNVGHRESGQYMESLRNGMGQDFGGSNGRAAFASQCTLFLVALFGSIKSMRVRLVVIFLLFAGVYSVLFSYSRGAWLGFAFGLLYLGITRMRWMLVAILILAPFATVILPTSVIQRATMTYQEGELDASSEDRVEIWQHALQTTLRDPILGVGFDCYHYYRAGMDLLDTHNMYVKALVETGVVGLGLLIGLFVSAFRMGHKLAKTATDPFFKAIGAGFAAYMISVMITNIFGDRWTYIDLSSFTWILMALVAQGLEWTEAEKNAPLAATPEPAPASLPAVEVTATLVEPEPAEPRPRLKMRGVGQPR